MATKSINMVEAQVPGQQTEFEHVFPLVLKCETPGTTLEDAVAWVEQNRESLVEMATNHGAILFRGVPLDTPQDCDAFVSAFGIKNFPYIESLSNAVRVNFTERIFSANGT